MNLTVRIPDDLASRLAGAGNDLPHRMLRHLGARNTKAAVSPTRGVPPFAASRSIRHSGPGQNRLLGTRQQRLRAASQPSGSAMVFLWVGSD